MANPCTKACRKMQFQIDSRLFEVRLFLYILHQAENTSLLQKGVFQKVLEHVEETHGLRFKAEKHTDTSYGLEEPHYVFEIPRGEP